MPDVPIGGRPSEQLLTDLADISELAQQLDVRSCEDDFDVRLTTDDMLP
jgi:hypothetical protein